MKPFYKNLKDAMDLIDCEVFLTDSFQFESNRKALREFMKLWEEKLKEYEKLGEPEPLELE